MGRKPEITGRLLLPLFFLLLIPPAASAAERKKTQADKPGSSEVMVRMDDGTELATDVYLPGKKGRVPAVLVRTPYNKASEAWMQKAFHRLGIAAVVQDCRGKYRSGGVFDPFVNERTDGLATLRWIRSQPWSDGTVAGWGGSYVGFTQWAISDSLNFLTPLLTGASLYDLIYPDGLFSLHLAFLWGFLNASQTANPIPPAKIISAMSMLPLSAADDSTIRDLDFMNDWLSHRNYDSYWGKLNYQGMTKAPVVSVAGWYDIFLRGQISDFEALTVNGNKSARLIIGPWCHGNPGEKNEYGGKKKTGEPGMLLKYMEDFLTGKELKLRSPLKDEKYNLFIMERNEYAGSDVWPPKQTRLVKYYLGSNGTLGTAAEDTGGSTGYRYDPGDPCPNIGGTVLGADVGPARQNSNTGRADQAVFTMAVGDKALTLLGPISATLWLSGSTTCTDFIVCLQDVFPDGKIINIQEGGAHVSFTSQQPEKKDLSVWATGYQLNPGHSLRLVITSSWFPRYNRSLNTCEPALTADSYVIADQKIWFGGSTPSAVNLPVYETK